MSIWRTSRPRLAPSARRRPSSRARASRQQQIGDVDTGHEQHEHHRTDQREQRRPELPDHLFLQRKEHHRPAGVALRLLFLELRVDAPHLAVRPLERNTVAQAPDGVRTAAAAHRAKLLQRLPVWNQEVGLLTDDREAGRHDADHRPGTVSGRERQVEDVPAAAKASLPELVAQHDDRVVATEIFLGRVGAAERRLDAQRAKDIGGDREPGNVERLAVDDHGDAGRSHHAQMLERSRALAPGDEVGGGDHVADGAAAVGFPHSHDPIGLVVRQRRQHHRAHHAEDRRGRADAEGQRHQCRGGKARRPSQHAKAMPEITHRVFEQRKPDLVPGALLTRSSPPNLSSALRRASSDPCRRGGSSPSAGRCENESLRRDRSRTPGVDPPNGFASTPL